MICLRCLIVQLNVDAGCAVRSTGPSLNDQRKQDIYVETRAASVGAGREAGGQGDGGVGGGGGDGGGGGGGRAVG